MNIKQTLTHTLLTAVLLSSTCMATEQTAAVTASGDLPTKETGALSATASAAVPVPSDATADSASSGASAVAAVSAPAASASSDLPTDPIALVARLRELRAGLSPMLDGAKSQPGLFFSCVNTIRDERDKIKAEVLKLLPALDALLPQYDALLAGRGDAATTVVLPTAEVPQPVAAVPAPATVESKVDPAASTVHAASATAASAELPTDPVALGARVTVLSGKLNALLDSANSKSGWVFSGVGGIERERDALKAAIIDFLPVVAQFQKTLDERVRSLEDQIDRAVTFEASLVREKTGLQIQISRMEKSGLEQSASHESVVANLHTLLAESATLARAKDTQASALTAELLAAKESLQQDLAAQASQVATLKTLNSAQAAEINALQAAISAQEMEIAELRTALAGSKPSDKKPSDGGAGRSTKGKKSR